MVPPPKAKEISEGMCCFQLFDECWDVFVEKGIDHGLEFRMSLVDSRLASTKDSSLLSQFGNVVVDVLRYGMRIRTWWQRLERGGLVAMKVDAVLLDALACSQTITFLSCHARVFDLEALLEG